MTDVAVTPPDMVFDGPAEGPLVVLAHGAGAPLDSPFLSTFASGLASQGVRVARFEFPYMAARRTGGKKRPPDRAPVLLACWRAVIHALGGGQRLIIGGKSMGGRFATLIAAQLEAEGTPVAGVACLGYPFHPPGKSDSLRIEHLAAVTTPTLILQGARDSLGWYDEVITYPLSPAVQVHWLEDGDHDLKPRAASGRTMRQNHAEAIDHLVTFTRHILG